MRLLHFSICARPLRLCVVALTLSACSASVAVAQRPGGGGGGGQRGPGGFGGGMGESRGRNPFPEMGSRPDTRNAPPPGAQPRSSSPVESTMHGGLQLGPPGRWWDDKRFASTIGIDSAQQRRMDDVFGANKGTLVKLYKNLQHEENQLGKIVRGKNLVESEIFDQIDRVAQARAELEKANAHMLLQLRGEMTPEQAARLDEHREAPSQ